MYIALMDVHGLEAALYGLGLSHGLTSGLDYAAFLSPDCAALRVRLLRRAEKLAGRGGGHDKFLRAIAVTLSVRAPLYWWKQFDTYKVGTVTQSESTMHTLMRTPLRADMFAASGRIPGQWLVILEDMRKTGDFTALNACLPQSFLQHRVVVTNYAALGNIMAQRQAHKLAEWRMFCEFLTTLPHQELLYPVH